jgi:hypothetical protein
MWPASGQFDHAVVGIHWSGQYPRFKSCFCLQTLLCNIKLQGISLCTCRSNVGNKGFIVLILTGLPTQAVWVGYRMLHAWKTEDCTQHSEWTLQGSTLYFEMLRRIVIALMMEAIRISEASVSFYQSTWRNIPEVANSLEVFQEIFVGIPHFSHSFCAFYPSHITWFDHPVHITWMTEDNDLYTRHRKNLKSHSDLEWNCHMGDHTVVERIIWKCLKRNSVWMGWLDWATSG